MHSAAAGPSYLDLKELAHLQQDLLGIGVLLLPINASLQETGEAA